METKEKLQELTDRLHRIRRELRKLPERKEQFEDVLNELKSQWSERLAQLAIGELTEEELEQCRQELALTDRNRRELGELEAGLLALEKQVLAEMRPLQKKLRLEQAKARYAELAEKLEAGGYNRHLAQDFRMVAHEIGRDKECNELLKKLEYIRDRELSFEQIHGLQAQSK